MRTLVLLFLLAASPAFACHVETFTFDRVEPFADERVEAVMRGSCPDARVPFRASVRAAGALVTIDLTRGNGPALAVSEWGERVRLPRLFAGTYQVQVRVDGQTVAQKPLVVRERPFRIAPELGGAGDEVKIEGVHVLGCVQLHCPSLTVFFGNTPSEEVRLTPDGAIVAVVPPGSGRVDVTVRVPTLETVTVRGGFDYGFASVDAYARVLIPLNYIGAGAHGSQWRTDVRLRNDGPITVPTDPGLYIDPDSPILPIPLPGIPPEGRARFGMRGGDGGEFLYAPRELERHLTYASHIVDLSRSTTDLGAEMPLVRKDDTAHTIRLLDVPLESRYRARLRVYDFDAPANRQVLVQTLDPETGATLSMHSLTLTADPNCNLAVCLPRHPPFAVLDLDQVAVLRGRERVDVTIAPYERDGRIWAFVSVTNNDTQSVTLHSPQHATGPR